jgi:D-alanyl-D-alanine carboxypeptidase
MQNSTFDSPHGLCNIFNVSTAFDMGLLTAKCMEIETFKEVVRTKVYSVQTDRENYEWQ